LRIFSRGAAIANSQGRKPLVRRRPNSKAPEGNAVKDFRAGKYVSCEVRVVSAEISALDNHAKSRKLRQKILHGVALRGSLHGSRLFQGLTPLAIDYRRSAAGMRNFKTRKRGMAPFLGCASGSQINAASPRPP